MAVWSVKVVNRVRPWIRIEADYYRIEVAGTVVFRKLAVKDGEYPIAVHAFAPREWLQIKRVETGKPG